MQHILAYMSLQVISKSRQLLKVVANTDNDK